MGSEGIATKIHLAPIGRLQDAVTVMEYCADPDVRGTSLDFCFVAQPLDVLFELDTRGVERLIDGLSEVSRVLFVDGYLVGRHIEMNPDAARSGDGDEPKMPQASGASGQDVDVLFELSDALEDLPLNRRCHSWLF